MKNAPPQGDIGLRFHMYKVFWIGANYRSINYAVIEAGFRVKEIFTFAYAYQMNISKYRRDIGGTHEVSLGIDLNRKAGVPVGRQLFNPRF